MSASDSKNRLLTTMDLPELVCDMRTEEPVNLVYLLMNPGYGKYTACMWDVKDIVIEEAMANAVL